jgi:hypothetical protein
MGTYDPAWADAPSTTTIPLVFDGSLDTTQNGARLADAVAALRAGDTLAVGPGTWSVNRWWNVTLQGTAEAPIRIVAADPTDPPVVTRPDAAQNVMNVGSSGTRTEYVCFRDLEFTGGDTLIKLYDVANVWIDRCRIHDGDGVGIAANSANVEFLYVTRNEIFDPGSSDDTSEGMYLGANHGASVMRYSVIALNHVHDCRGTQGDGIEVKQGSYANWIVENHVHDTNYPCLLLYGTNGEERNVVEKNVLYRSNDNTLQVQGEAIVRFNLVLGGATGFGSHDHQGETRDLQFVHNTIVTTNRGANLSSWNDRAGMVFANNAVYSRDAESIRFPNGSAGVTVAGNVVLGSVVGVGAGAGYATGRGLEDFHDVAWDASRRDGTPSEGSALTGAAAPAHALQPDVGAFATP